MVDEDRIFAVLNRLENKVDGLGSQVGELQTQSAVVTERLGNMANITQAHLSADNLLHDTLQKRITSLEEFRTGWKARVSTVGAVTGALIAIPIGLIVAIMRDIVGGH